MRLTEASLAPLRRGCMLLGSGGGGDPEVSLFAAAASIRAGGDVELVAPEALPPDSLVLPCGLIGSPAVSAEKIMSGREGRVLTERVAALRALPVSALMPYEIGGSNGVTPICWAAEQRLPLVDADGMGRAFPGMNQSAFALRSVSAVPMVVTDPDGNFVTIEAVDPLLAERIARQTTLALGGIAAIGLYPAPPAEIARSAITGSVTRALRLGQVLEEAGPAAPAALQAAGEAELLFQGRVVDVHKASSPLGYSSGFAILRGLDHFRRRVARLEFQNEFLLLLEDGATVCSAPEIISVIDVTDGAVALADTLATGARVAIVRLPVDRVWHTPPGLELGGAAAFGYPADVLTAAAGSARR
jgi:DUF917 family protein